MQRTEASRLLLYQKLQIQLGLLRLPKRQLFFLFLFKIIPQISNSYGHASLGLCFKTFNTTVGDIIPKKHLFFFFLGTEMLLCRPKEI